MAVLEPAPAAGRETVQLAINTTEKMMSHPERVPFTQNA
jgi:hypothetical protein